jgi:hypothetical protein
MMNELGSALSDRTAVAARGLVCRYRPVRAVDELSFEVDGQLTGYENVWLFARLFDVPRPERRAQVEGATPHPRRQRDHPRPVPTPAPTPSGSSSPCGGYASPRAASAATAPVATGGCGSTSVRPTRATPPGL